MNKNAIFLIGALILISLGLFFLLYKNNLPASVSVPFVSTQKNEVSFKGLITDIRVQGNNLEITLSTGQKAVVSNEAGAVKISDIGKIEKLQTVAELKVGDNVEVLAKYDKENNTWVATLIYIK